MEPPGGHDVVFRRLFDEHYDAIARYCLRRLPREDANDAAAQVFVVAWRKIEKMPDGPGALPWLYRIAHFEVSTIRRTGRRATALRARLTGLAPTYAQSPDGVVVRRAEHEAVIRALAKLSPSDRDIILLRSYEELSTKQIAVVLGCSPEAAKKRLTRALRRLRKTADLAEAAVSLRNPRAIREGGDG